MIIQQPVEKYRNGIGFYGFVVAEIYEMLWLCFFTWMILFASKSIQSITDEIENSFSTLGGATGHQVMNWTRRYCSILKFIDGIDEFFGATLLILTIKISFGVTLGSICLVRDFHQLSSEDVVYMVLHITTKMIAISIIIWVTEIMKEKVKITLKHTLSIDENVYFQSWQASNLVEELTKCYSMENASQSEVGSIMIT